MRVRLAAREVPRIPVALRLNPHAPGYALDVGVGLEIQLRRGRFGRNTNALRAIARYDNRTNIGLGAADVKDFGRFFAGGRGGSARAKGLPDKAFEIIIMSSYFA
jgi:hypothetical protein